MAKRKCVICGEWIVSEVDAIPYKNRYAHRKCFDISMKILVKDKKETLESKIKPAKAAQPKAELKNALSEEDYQQKNQYFDYIRNKLGSEKLPAKVYKLSNDYIDKYGFTYLGMVQALWYFTEVKEQEVTGDMVGILPYIYDEAQAYYSLSKQTAMINSEFQEIQSLYPKRKIRLSPPKIPKPFIDVSKLGIREEKDIE